MSAILRLLDANFNRAREALRVLEDLVRFGRDDRSGREALKRLRHRLSALERPMAARLLAARDSARDVGRGDAPGATRGDAASANFKRSQEALRSIEEGAKTFDPVLARAASAIRYELYDLERRLRPGLDRRGRLDGVRLYVILDSRRAPLLRSAREAVAGGAEALQLREEAPDRELLRTARSLRDDALLIVNNRADIATASGAGGVHVGAEDLPVAETRRIVGEGIVGATSHSLAEAKAAAAAGADYVSCGPVFPSPTKPGLAARGLAYLRGAMGLGLPVFCIGGITAQNVRDLVKRGADRVAVCASVVGARDIRSAARRIRRLLPR